ncbi:glucuronyl hydrolase [Coprinopsis cinerea okayama7|uniref:Glucuronyl hydrolase n=1 Tax=Coprinopsis cinerea (strain Okayama-7 / 130 / ATCC MYA-4618 / FGSC 9003) TaxID=240176 RepID=A8NHB2_COPC7|nr:glucuronyl hydrolase [Coprinopsis cinerea okayama7\|eukprot:XP_001833726.1 glucuronyl hydrolase [Coprinopsis cinerea okayama7\
MLASTTILLAALLLPAQLTVAQIPPELFSPLGPQKVLAAERARPNQRWPQWTNANGQWVWFDAGAWTSGFFPATHYALNSRRILCGANAANGLNIADWRALGINASRGLPLDARSVGHDVGFISFPFVEELALNPNDQTAIRSINSLANALAQRFNDRVGCTRSWDTSDPNQFTVIIDNMMNLELLFHSARLTGNQRLRDIAIRHADTTMRHHIRPDGGTWHVVDYDARTGGVIRKRTAQGYSDSSTWTRGQSWGIYGFANMHRLTGEVRYLDTARRMANYFLSRLPADGFVPWDFDAPTTPTRLADSSASALVANALLLLARQDPANAQHWRDNAIRILAAVTRLAWRPNWQSLLSNGTVHRPQNNYNTGTVYGDYYYILAGNELIASGLAACPRSADAFVAVPNTSNETTSDSSDSVDPEPVKDDDTNSALAFNMDSLLGGLLAVAGLSLYTLF